MPYKSFANRELRGRLSKPRFSGPETGLGREAGNGFFRPNSRFTKNLQFCPNLCLFWAFSRFGQSFRNLSEFRVFNFPAPAKGGKTPYALIIRLRGGLSRGIFGFFSEEKGKGGFRADRGRGKSGRGGNRTHTPSRGADFKSAASAVPPLGRIAAGGGERKNGGGNRIRTGDRGFANLCLTTWLCRLATPIFYRERRPVQVFRPASGMERKARA